MATKTAPKPKRIKIRIEASYEYVPEHYDGKTIEEAVKIDTASFERMPEALFELLLNTDYTLTVKPG